MRPVDADRLIEKWEMECGTKTTRGTCEGDCFDCHFPEAIDDLKDAPTIDAVPVPDGGIGELSDGYHTFNGLYYQRMMLFAALVKTYKERAWKSRRHSDGEPCFGGGWFIVGIDTPQGGFTYHYEDKYFDLFDCIELPNGKEWDGHTEDDVTRLLILDAAPVVFINDPFHVVYQAFKELYPDKECEILFDYNVETTDTHERVKGVTIFPDDGSIPQIRIDCEQTIDRITEILAHELAHVALGKPTWDDKELDHGEDFEKTLDAIFDRFNELQGFRADGERKDDGK